jgi:hypothetical protein
MGDGNDITASGSAGVSLIGGGINGDTPESYHPVCGYTVSIDGNPVNALFPFEKVANFINKIKNSFPLLFSPNKNHNHVKINEIILRDKLYEMNFFETIKLSETQIFSELLNYNKKLLEDYKSKLVKTKADVELYTRIYEKHKFYCLLVRNYAWLDLFYNHLLNL